MKPIDRSEVLGLAEYESVRAQFRSRVIAEKKRRRVELGPHATATFENRDTILLQIQEMLRTERITRPAAVAHEIDTYNENMPGDAELSCTVMIDVVDPVEREAFLRKAAGFEKSVWLAVAGERIPARPAPRHGALPDRTTAVHYLKFPLPPAASTRVLAAPSTPVEVTLGVDHPTYEARAVLPRETVLELSEDLRS
jgi:hypothetical protein